ncbi:MAG: ATP phosphoribosyltransferase regulatory subunit [Dehalococcoidia bacterium]
MSEATTTQRSRGMRDLVPDEMERVRQVESAFAAVCRAWGYREIRTPVIEPLHLFTTAGTLSPQALDRVYSFLDWDGWSGERVVLRPDSTIPTARLYGERLDGGRVAKLFYRQNVFRFAADESSREEWQCGVELIGQTGLAGDVELALMGLGTLRSLDLSDITLTLSHAGLIRVVLGAAELTPDEQSAAYDRLLDGDQTVIEEMETRLPLISGPLRLLLEVEGQGSGYLAEVRKALGGAIAALVPPLDDLGFVVQTLEACGVSPRVRAVLARSFEYYSGVVMRFDVGGRQVGGGGRYDELIGVVGGREAPASGFALYVEPLSELLPRRAEAPGARLLLAPSSGAPEDVAAVFDAASRLRALGVDVETVDADGGASRRLVCRAVAPRFELADGDTRRTFEDAAAVARALGQERP